MNRWLKLIKFFLVVQLIANISCNVETTDDQVNSNSVPGYTKVRIQNDTLGYYRFDNTKINNVDFGSIDSETTSQYFEVSSDQDISVSIDMYNEIQKKTEGTATQSDWSLTGRFKKDVYLNFRLYFDSDTLEVKLDISEAASAQGDPTYLALNNPSVKVQNDTSGLVRFENVTINNISFGNIQPGTTSVSKEVSALVVISLSMDIYRESDNVSLGTADESTWELTGNLLKGKDYTWRFYYNSLTDEIVLDMTDTDQ